VNSELPVDGGRLNFSH